MPPLEFWTAFNNFSTTLAVSFSFSFFCSVGRSSATQFQVFIFFVFFLTDHFLTRQMIWSIQSKWSSKLLYKPVTYPSWVQPSILDGIFVYITLIDENGHLGMAFIYVIVQLKITINQHFARMMFGLNANLNRLKRTFTHSSNDTVYIKGHSFFSSSVIIQRTYSQDMISIHLTSSPNWQRCMSGAKLQPLDY